MLVTFRIIHKSVTGWRLSVLGWAGGGFALYVCHSPTGISMTVWFCPATSMAEVEEDKETCTELLRTCLGTGPSSYLPYSIGQSK